MLLSDSAYLPQVVEVLLIPYDDMLMLSSDSAYLSKGVVEDLLISYEDKLMLFLIQHICQREWWIC